eukprot:5293853-Prymnesium_polylepis.1
MLSCLCAVRRRQQEQTDNGARNAASYNYSNTRADSSYQKGGKRPDSAFSCKTRVAVCRVFWLARRALCYCSVTAMQKAGVSRATL